MKKPLNQDRLNRYLAFLNEIRASEGKPISLVKLCKVHCISAHACGQVFKLGLVNYSTDAKVRGYYKASFDAFEPVHAKKLYEGVKVYAAKMAMAKRHREKINKNNLVMKNASPMKQQSENNQRTIRVPVPKVKFPTKPSSNGHSADKPLRKISILWGLYTKTY